MLSYALANEMLESTQSLSITIDELASVCMEAAEKALAKYDDKYYTVYFYFKKIAIRNMVDLIKKHIKFFQCGFKTVSLDSDNLYDSPLSDYIGTNDDFEEGTVADSITNVMIAHPESFSDFEMALLNLYLSGYDLKEISKVLKINKSKTYRTYHQIIDKLRHFLVGKK